MKFRHRIPPEIAAAIELGSGEKPLAWASDDAGRYVVATHQSLILQRRPPVYERIGWEEIDQASYEDGVLNLTLVPDPSGAAARLRIRVGDDVELPIAVRDRVTASIVVNQHVRLRGRKGVRIVARRRAGEADLRWGFVFDSGLEPQDQLRERAEALVEQVRQESGLG